MLIVLNIFMALGMNKTFSENSFTLLCTVEKGEPLESSGMPNYH